MTTRIPELPHRSDRLFLIDGGLETTLVFHDGIDLPHFAAFDLLRRIGGLAHLQHYYRRYAEIARDVGAGFILEAPTWRANGDWGRKLGYDAQALRAANVVAVEMMVALREELATQTSPMVVSGCIGPRGDGYAAGTVMTPEAAEAYHAPQIAAFVEAGAEMATAMTMTHAGEAIGIVRAARAAGLPIAISFTVETDGRLPDGTPLPAAIAAVDDRTNGGAAYFMINCAHPSHFADALMPGARWMDRVQGLRANASRLSHAELDCCQTLDAGNPEALGEDYAILRRVFPKLRVLGGCCGTDDRHIAAIARHCTGRARHHAAA